MTQLSEARRDVSKFINDGATRKKLALVTSQAIEPAKVVRLTLNALSATPKLAQCSLDSLFGCMMTSASLGLELNTPLEHAWLIPYDNRRLVDNKWQTVTEAQLMVGYKGYIALAHRSPKLVFLMAEAVRENDQFESYISSECETGAFLRYEKELRNRGELTASFCYTRTVGQEGARGDAVTILPYEEIMKLRGRSETLRYLTRQVESEEDEGKRKKAQKKLDETPWNLWPDAMWVKSAIRRHVKLIPLTPQLAVAGQVDAASEDGRFDAAAMVRPELVSAVAEGEVDAPRVIEGESEQVPDDDSAPAAGAAQPTDDKPPPKKGRGRPRKDKDKDTPPKDKPSEDKGQGEEPPPLTELTGEAEPKEDPPAKQDPPPDDKAQDQGDDDDQGNWFDED